MNAVKNNISATTHFKAEKAAYILWEDDIIIEEGEVVTGLVEMEK